MERSETDFTVGNLYIFANIWKGTDFLLRGLTNDSKNETKTYIGSDEAWDQRISNYDKKDGGQRSLKDWDTPQPFPPPLEKGGADPVLHDVLSDKK